MGMGVFGGILSLLVLIIQVVAIVTVLSDEGTIGKKILWILLIIVLPIIGVVLYFLVGRD